MNQDEKSKSIFSNLFLILGRHGPRLTGTRQSSDAVKTLRNLLRDSGIPTRIECFYANPPAFLSIGKAFLFSYCISLVALLVKNRLLGSIVASVYLMITLYLICEFILYNDWFDRLFPKAIGRNILGVVNPKKEKRYEIILVSHHDSSVIYPFHESRPTLFPIRLVAPMFFYALLGFVLVCNLVLGKGTIPFAVKAAFVLGLAAVVPMFGYFSKEASLGAGDNLIGCMINLELAKCLKGKLENVGLRILMCDAEELGQKGSSSYVKRHRNELRSDAVEVINIDSIYDEEHLAVVGKDRNGTIKLDDRMIHEILEAAKKEKVSLKVKGIPFGGGGTDAAQFAKRNIRAVSILGLDTGAIRKKIIIHTGADNGTNIEEKAVMDVLRIVKRYVVEKDKSLGSGS